MKPKDDKKEQGREELADLTETQDVEEPEGGHAELPLPTEPGQSHDPKTPPPPEP